MADKQRNKKTSSERLEALISYLGFKSGNSFSEHYDIPQSEVSRIKSDKREISPALAYKIAKSHNEIRMEWMVDGTGEMLKVEKTPGESWPLGAEEGYFFPSNLSVLIEMLKIDNLPSLIPISQQVITDLISGTRRPSVALLIRLREVFGVAIDTMLLSDLQLPENMEHLKNTQPEGKPEGLGEVQKTLEAILARMDEMKAAQTKMETELERLKKDREGVASFSKDV